MFTNPEMNFLDIGKQGEEEATRYLKSIGYVIIARNVVIPIGRTSKNILIKAEIDIVAFEKNVLVFVEVKARTSEILITPEAAVTFGKQRKLKKAALRYRRIIGPACNYRFDVIGIVYIQNQNPQIRLQKGIF